MHTFLNDFAAGELGEWRTTGLPSWIDIGTESSSGTSNRLGHPSVRSISGVGISNLLPVMLFRITPYVSRFRASALLSVWRVPAIAGTLGWLMTRSSSHAFIPAVTSSPNPGAESTMIRSYWSLSWSSIPLRSISPRSPWYATDPGMKWKPYSVVLIASLISILPMTTSCITTVGSSTPRWSPRFDAVMLVSTMMTLFSSFFPSPAPRFATVVVFPTPPFAEYTPRMSPFLFLTIFSLWVVVLRFFVLLFFWFFGYKVIKLNWVSDRFYFFVFKNSFFVVVIW